MMSAPWLRNIAAIFKPSSGVTPCATQSVAEMRTEIGLWLRPVRACHVEDFQRKPHAISRL
jgi:hypothetical protein